jgi:hypothetical protein
VTIRLRIRGGNGTLCFEAYGEGECDDLMEVASMFPSGEMAPKDCRRAGGLLRDKGYRSIRTTDKVLELVKLDAGTLTELDQ